MSPPLFVLNTTLFALILMTLPQPPFMRSGFRHQNEVNRLKSDTPSRVSFWTADPYLSTHFWEKMSNSWNLTCDYLKEREGSISIPQAELMQLLRFCPLIVKKVREPTLSISNNPSVQQLQYCLLISSSIPGSKLVNASFMKATSLRSSYWSFYSSSQIFFFNSPISISIYSILISASEISLLNLSALTSISLTSRLTQSIFLFWKSISLLREEILPRRLEMFRSFSRTSLFFIVINDSDDCFLRWAYLSFSWRIAISEVISVRISSSFKIYCLASVELSQMKIIWEFVYQTNFYFPLTLSRSSFKTPYFCVKVQTSSFSSYLFSDIFMNFSSPFNRDISPLSRAIQSSANSMIMLSRSVPQVFCSRAPLILPPIYVRYVMVSLQVIESSFSRF